VTGSATGTGTGTATTQGARTHARAQAGARAEAMPTLPASSWPEPPEGVPAGELTWAETIGGGGYASRVLAAGTSLRLRDLHGEACAHVLLYNADQPWERLNVADTVKVLWQAYLGPGHLLLSDQGRVLASIVADTSTHHDALCGTTTRAANAARYGDGSAFGPTPAGRELLLLAGARHGLGPRDLPPSLSFFQAVAVDADGRVSHRGSAGPGAAVTLRAELPVVVLIANAPHPVDRRPRYTCSTLEVLAWRGAPTGPGDPLWSATPEAERAFLNTADYAGARGI
jgi:urea carboxylase-associated protein 2